MSESNTPAQNNEEIDQQIREVIASVAREQMDPDSDGLQYLELDSLEKLEILTLLERRFGVTLTEEVARQFTSISSIARMVLRTRNAIQENWNLKM